MLLLLLLGDKVDLLSFYLCYIRVMHPHKSTLVAIVKKICTIFTIMETEMHLYNFYYPHGIFFYYDNIFLFCKKKIEVLVYVFGFLKLFCSFQNNGNGTTLQNLFRVALPVYLNWLINWLISWWNCNVCLFLFKTYF